MKKIMPFILFLLFFASLFLWNNCYGPAQVRVGVGVAVPGPWIGGPYPGGGGVWVGRPYPGPYYPALDRQENFLQTFNPGQTTESTPVLSSNFPEPEKRTEN